MINQTESIWFGSVRSIATVSSIGSEIKLTQCSVFDLVRLPNLIHELSSTEFD